MTHSDSIKEIATALAKAQGEMAGAKKDSTNPHYNSRYADLASVRDAVQEPFAKHGLSVLQSPRLAVEQEGPMLVEVETLLMHVSGEWIRDVLRVPVSKPDAQGVGSALTYARRYSLAAFAGVAPEDDDANAAVGTPSKDAVPAGAMETITTKVLNVTQRPTNNGGTKYTIVTNAGAFSSIKKQHAEDAKLAKEAGAEVELTWKQTHWGRDIVALKDLALAEPPV